MLEIKRAVFLPVAAQEMEQTVNPQWRSRSSGYAAEMELAYLRKWQNISAQRSRAEKVLLEGMAPEAMERTDIEDLKAALLLARNHVRLLQALIRARRPCAHDWAVCFPSRQRDNGEYQLRCKLCGHVS